MKLSVSVVIPYYKNEKYFSRAYFSVLNQTYKPNEIIVICDEPAKQAKLFLKKIIKSDRKKTILIFNKKIMVFLIVEILLLKLQNQSL